MGHRKKHAPKRGSLSYSPRKRANSLVPRVKTWPRLDVEEPTILGFSGYKAGMTGVVYVENDRNSINYGKEVFTAATVLETPPLYAEGLVTYRVSQEENRLKSSCMAFAENISADLSRRIKNLAVAHTRRKLEVIERTLDSSTRLRILFSAQPRLAGIRKKTPELFEVEIGGGASPKEKFSFATKLLGRAVPVDSVHRPGDVIDVSAVTKGKGFQGPVKRWGIKILPPKSRKSKRKPGALGPWKPASTMYTVPAAGQMGYHRRTQYGVKILGIRRPESRSEFHRYGVLKSHNMILKGSIPGPVRRFVKTRPTLRPRTETTPAPELIYVQKGV
ncbi:MAG: 50S ribosomal protein L3 [Candidatus Geothermarchaeales archaeon]